MKLCLLSPNNLETKFCSKYWKGKFVDNIFVQIKKVKIDKK